jgi:NTE family protein
VTFPAAEALRGKVTQALVLSGAGNRFVIELGVVKAFWDFGLRFDLSVGSSAGSLLAAWMAASPDRLDVVDGLSRRAKFSDIYAFNWEVVYKLAAADGLFTNDPLLRLVDRHFPEPLLESFKTPVLITATDLRTGATVVFSRGSVRDAIGASTAIPAVVKPRKGLVDGGLGDDLPVDLAVDAGAPVVYAVQAGYAGRLDQPPHGLLNIEQQAWSIAVARKTALDLEAAASKTALKLFEPRIAFDLPPWQYSGLGAYIDRAYAWTMEQLAAGKHLAPGSVRIRPA